MALPLFDIVWLYRAWDVALGLTVLVLLIVLLRLFREILNGLAQLYVATAKLAADAGEERFLEQFEAVAGDDGAVGRKVRDLLDRRDERLAKYSEFVEWRDERTTSELPRGKRPAH